MDAENKNPLKVELQVLVKRVPVFAIQAYLIERCWALGFIGPGEVQNLTVEEDPRGRHNTTPERPV